MVMSSSAPWSDRQPVCARHWSACVAVPMRPNSGGWAPTSSWPSCAADAWRRQTNIGAHALVNNLQRLTRDAARCRTYFPKLEIITP